MSLLAFAEALGIKLGLDWDGELLIEYPEILSRLEIEAAVAPFEEDLALAISLRAKRLLNVLVGGPFNGRRNFSGCCHGETFGRRVSRAHWAVYRQGDDGRAFFIGYATSQRKARRGVLKSKTNEQEGTEATEP